MILHVGLRAFGLRTGNCLSDLGDVGIANELTVGDITALTIYQAAQPRPVTKTELADLGLISLSSEEAKQIANGAAVFKQIKCTDCHAPELLLDSSIFSEPSRMPAYRDRRFPSGVEPPELGLTPRAAVTFDLTRDLPDNIDIKKF